MFIIKQKIESLEKRLYANPLHSSPTLPQLYERYANKEACRLRIRETKKKIQAKHDILHLEELKSRKRVLRRLGFTTHADIIDTKGRVACEISTGDELLLTELIFNGVFNPLLPEQCAALLSCFVFAEKVCGSLKFDFNRIFNILSERTSCQAEGRTSWSVTLDARNCAENCESR